MLIKTLSIDFKIINLSKGLVLKITNNRILCIGEVLWDVLTEKKRVGGAPLNVAVNLARLQNKVDIISKVGDDENGRELMEFIRSNNLINKHIKVDTVFSTGVVYVKLDNQNNATYKIPEPVAWDRIMFDPITEGISKKADITVYGTLGSRHHVSRKTIEKVLKNNSTKIIDVNLRPPFIDHKLVNKLIRKADIAKLNSEELSMISDWHKLNTANEEEMMRNLTELFSLDLLCVTKGERGAVLYDGLRFYEHKGFKINVVDTVGSGDAFLAGLIHAIANKEHIQDALKFACAMGAYITGQNGASPNFTIKNIENIMNKR